jgi:hypothetical protein
MVDEHALFLSKSDKKELEPVSSDRYVFSPHKVTDKDRGLSLPDTFLESYGCLNCSLKALGLCKEGLLDPDEVIPSGWCLQLVEFVFDQCSSGDSLSAIKEKYLLEIRTQMHNTDLTEYNLARREVRRLKRVGASKQEIAAAELKEVQARLYYECNSNAVNKGLARITDREQRNKEQKLAVTHKIELSQIHQLARDAQKESEIIDVPLDDKQEEVDKNGR